MVAARMSIVELHRIKALEAELVITKARLEKLEGFVFGVDANDEMTDFNSDIVPPRRKPGRPKKEAA